MPPESEVEREKRAAAEAAAELVEDGMTVGLGTGSTVAYLLPALAARGLADPLRRHLARDRGAARELGLEVEPFDQLDRLDIAIDGADQVTPDGWLVKGGGGAHVREKIVAAAAERFVVIVDSGKPVEELTPPVPLELSPSGCGRRFARWARPSCATRRRAPTGACSPTTWVRSATRRRWPPGSGGDAGRRRPRAVPAGDGQRRAGGARRGGAGARADGIAWPSSAAGGCGG